MAGWRIPGFAARPRFTSRATVLVLVLCSVVAILAYPTRQFVSQRSEISAQRARAEHARQQVEQLRREKVRWQDPEYVKAQARARLHYALPGETPFVAADPSAAAGPGAGRTPGQPSAGTPAAAGPPATGPAVPVKAAQPWYTTLWRSVDAADTAALAPPPAAPFPSAPASASAGDSSPHDH